MKKLYTFILCILIAGKIFASNITIIQASNAIWTSDTVWNYVANSMGHNSSIQPETILDNTAFFSTTDVLITPDYNINYTPLRISNLIAFMQTGKSVYIQSEYDLSFNGNQTFQSMVNTLGGSFAWIGTVSGVLAPMNVLGTLANTPLTIPPLTYYWYGCNATVCNNFDSF